MHSRASIGATFTCGVYSRYLFDNNMLWFMFWHHSLWVNVRRCVGDLAILRYETTTKKRWISIGIFISASATTEFYGYFCRRRFSHPACIRWEPRHNIRWLLLKEQVRILAACETKHILVTILDVYRLRSSRSFLSLRTTLIFLMVTLYHN
jgi:hypothetical protein